MQIYCHQSGKETVTCPVSESCPIFPPGPYAPSASCWSQCWWALQAIPQSTPSFRLQSRGGPAQTHISHPLRFSSFLVCIEFMQYITRQYKSIQYKYWTMEQITMKDENPSGPPFPCLFPKASSSLEGSPTHSHLCRSHPNPWQKRNKNRFLLNNLTKEMAAAVSRITSNVECCI